MISARLATTAHWAEWVRGRGRPTEQWPNGAAAIGMARPVLFGQFLFVQLLFGQFLFVNALRESVSLMQRHAQFAHLHLAYPALESL